MTKTTNNLSRTVTHYQVEEWEDEERMEIILPPKKI
jgi:hypothetical protein